MHLLRYFALVFSLSSLVFTSPATADYGDEKYQPRVGQQGKDVIWVPTPDDLVVKMLETAKVTSKDVVYDLGAGDGKIPIQAARQFGARAFGIEYNADMAALARRNAQRAGVADKVTIITGDIFKEDFSKATVVTMYLLPELNLRLKPLLLKMKPGTRVVSHSFDMGSWEADEVIMGANSYYGYYWVVPAQAHGQWSLRGRSAEGASLQLVQKFQKLEGSMTLNGKKLALTEGRLNGPEITLRFSDERMVSHSISGTINGNKLEATLTIGETRTAITGARQ
jgi:hypothetical protein